MSTPPSLKAAVAAAVSPGGTFSAAEATEMDLRLIDVQIDAATPKAAASPAASDSVDADETAKRSARKERFSKPVAASTPTKAAAAASPFADAAAVSASPFDEAKQSESLWADSSDSDEGDGGMGFAPLARLAPVTPAKKAHAEVRAKTNDDEAQFALYKARAQGARTLSSTQETLLNDAISRSPALKKRVRAFNSSKAARRKAPVKTRGDVRPGGAPSGDARQQRGGGGQNCCFNCGKPGHISRDCSEPKKGGGRGGGGGGGRDCYNCGKSGHISRDCPEPKSKGGRGGGGGGRGGGRGGRSDDRTCHNCGKAGHLSRECPEGRKGGNRGGGNRGGGGGGGGGGSRGGGGGGGGSRPKIPEGATVTKIEIGGKTTLRIEAADGRVTYQPE